MTTLVHESDAALMVVEADGHRKLVDKFANEPGLKTCHRCRQRVPGVKDWSGGGNMLCWRCAEVMTDYWVLHTSPRDVPDTMIGMLRDERYKAYLTTYEIPEKYDVPLHRDAAALPVPEQAEGHVQALLKGRRNDDDNQD